MKNVIFTGLVVAAVFIGCELAYLSGKRMGIKTRFVIDGSLWGVAAGFTTSHLFNIVFYHPQRVLEDPLVLLMVWSSMSSFGGFFGGALGAMIYFRRKNVPTLPYVEAILFGFVPAWILGRLGCTIAFDHPGLPTTFFLGMADWAGVVRHNLGLYEMLYTVLLAAALYGLRNFRPFEGFHLVLIILLYSPVRFFLDTLRVADRRYWGYTPGQYFSVLLLALGVWLLVRGVRRRGEGATGRLNEVTTIRQGARADSSLNRLVDKS
jgi:phosphatidylglycerol:prolipoprotein diacylglycerol transferase